MRARELTDYDGYVVSRPDKDERALKIDDQVSKFLELNHQLTYFLITASVGPLAFALSFAASNKLLEGRPWWMLLVLATGALSALLAAASALFSLRNDQASFRSHLKYRYEGKSYEDISTTERATWDKFVSRAATLRRGAYVFLVSAVSLEVAFLFGSAFFTKDLPMHHYGEDSTIVQLVGTNFVLAFRNKVSGKELTFTVPVTGAKEDPDQKLTPQEARHLADEVAHLLRRTLE